MKLLPAHKRETTWLQMLEGMHWKEANILVHIKDQTLFDTYPNLREVFVKLGMQIDIEENSKKSRKKT
jgi:hypothetical protein